MNEWNVDWQQEQNESVKKSHLLWVDERRAKPKSSSLYNATSTIRKCFHTASLSSLSAYVIYFKILQIISYDALTQNKTIDLSVVSAHLQ